MANQHNSFWWKPQNNYCFRFGLSRVPRTVGTGHTIIALTVRSLEIIAGNEFTQMKKWELMLAKRLTKWEWFSNWMEIINYDSVESVAQWLLDSSSTLCRILVSTEYGHCKLYVLTAQRWTGWTCRNGCRRPLSIPHKFLSTAWASTLFLFSVVFFNFFLQLAGLCGH